MIAGFIGAGKTTLARQLEVDHNAIRFTHDEWMRTLFGANPPADTFREKHEAVSCLIDKTWKRACAVGANVVLDLNFWTRSQREEVRNYVLSIGGRPTFYFLSCDDEVALRRVQARHEMTLKQLRPPDNEECLYRPPVIKYRCLCRF